MDMNWLQSIVYGLVSGLSEFMPISTHAHQSLLLHLYGLSNRDPVRDLIVHIALLLSLYTGCKNILDQLRRETNLNRGNRRTHRGINAITEFRLIKNATISLVFCYIVLSYIFDSEPNLLISALFLFLNGLILYLPCRMIQANKDARTMSGFDSLLIGFAGAASALSGISRLGAIVCVSVARGAERRRALNWALLISVPALLLLIGLDLLNVFTHAGMFSFWGNLGGYILSALGAYCSGYVSIVLIRFLSERTGLTGFAYYSWGTAMFAFLLYLIVV